MYKRVTGRDETTRCVESLKFEAALYLGWPLFRYALQFSICSISIKSLHYAPSTMKIIIVGAGIAGLTTYLHLRKLLPHTHTIRIYESHQPRSKLSLSAQLRTTDSSRSPAKTHNLDILSESTAIVGGGLGVSPNGMRVLRDLDIELHDAVVAQGFPVDNFVFKGANGWTLGVAKTSDKLVRGDGEEEVCVASSRHGLWEAIMKSVGEGVVRYRKVASIERNTDGGKTVVTLVDEDGNEETDEADLLIGADGVKSVVRTVLFGDDAKFKPTYTYVGSLRTLPFTLLIVNQRPIRCRRLPADSHPTFNCSSALYGLRIRW